MDCDGDQLPWIDALNRINSEKEREEQRRQKEEERQRATRLLETLQKSTIQEPKNKVIHRKKEKKSKSTIKSPEHSEPSATSIPQPPIQFQIVEPPTNHILGYFIVFAGVLSLCSIGFIVYQFLMSLYLDLNYRLNEKSQGTAF
jgi:hypothetical protein